MQTEVTSKATELQASAAGLPQLHEPRNPGTDLDLDRVMAVQVNTSAVERRCATLPGRRSVKKDHQAAWLLKAVSMIDLTTLSGDDTEGRVRRLCAKARQPVAKDTLNELGSARSENRRGLRLSRYDRNRREGAGRHRHSRGRCVYRLPGWPVPLPSARG